MDNGNPSPNGTDDMDTLSQVASMIRPLPENVVPSDEFLRRTRVRLLKLDRKSAPAGRQAA